MGADIVTLHVPLTREGVDATWHLFDENRIQRMKPGSLLVNTSRGAVVSGEALQASLDAGHLSGAILDVWENEPDIDARLLETVDLGTPHIAGYSMDGKVKGMGMIYEAACRFFGIESEWSPAVAMPAPDTPFLECDPSWENDEETLNDIVRCIYDIERDDTALRRFLDMPLGERGAWFRQLRKTYPVRREFFNTTLRCSADKKGIRRKFSALGFRLEEEVRIKRW